MPTIWTDFSTDDPEIAGMLKFIAGLPQYDELRQEMEALLHSQLARVAWQHAERLRNQRLERERRERRKQDRAQAKADAAAVAGLGGDSADAEKNPGSESAPKNFQVSVSTPDPDPNLAQP